LLQALLDLKVETLVRVHARDYDHISGRHAPTSASTRILWILEAGAFSAANRFDQIWSNRLRPHVRIVLTSAILVLQLFVPAALR
jgi:hypothetical protein